MLKLDCRLFMAVTVHIAVFWNVTTHSFVLATCVTEKHAACNFGMKVRRLRMQS